MPWGKKSEDHDTSALSPSQRRSYNKKVAELNQEAKRRVQQVRKTTNRDGNKGTR
jgi:hypothetical protein